MICRVILIELNYVQTHATEREAPIKAQLQQLVELESHPNVEEIQCKTLLEVPWLDPISS